VSQPVEFGSGSSACMHATRPSGPNGLRLFAIWKSSVAAARRGSQCKGEQAFSSGAAAFWAWTQSVRYMRNRKVNMRTRVTCSDGEQASAMYSSAGCRKSVQTASRRAENSCEQSRRTLQAWAETATSTSKCPGPCPSAAGWALSAEPALGRIHLGVLCMFKRHECLGRLRQQGLHIRSIEHQRASRCVQLPRV
jgi:hypothetical protein